jgi:aryl-alcohol dehydrogenase-like predicted oxidoreductase
VIETVRLNRLETSALGLGLAALGRPGYLNLGHGADLGSDRSVGGLERRTHEVLDAAHAAGVRYFDAARSYGRAEEFLGEWLSGRLRDDVVVGSKWGYVYTADWEVDADPPEVKHHDADTFRRQLEETHRLLGDRLALYQIHSATPDSGVLEDEAVLADLRDLRAGGVAIGVTVSGPSQPEMIDRARELGIFDAVQATWNLHERAAEDALRRAHDAGIEVLVKEALANGRLTARAGNAILDHAATKAETTADALALAAALVQPFTDVVLSGAASVDTLRSNLAAVHVSLPDDALPALDVLREDSARYWTIRGGMEWT